MDLWSNWQSSSSFCSGTGTKCIGFPFLWSIPATPRGGSWCMGNQGSPYHLPRLETLGKLLPQTEMPGDTQQKWGYHNTKKYSEWKQRRKGSKQKRLYDSRPTMAFICSKCGRACHSWIGLHSHNRCCTMGANLWYFETDRCHWKILLLIKLPSDHLKWLLKMTTKMTTKITTKMTTKWPLKRKLK